MKNKHIAQLENMAISPLLASIGCNGAVLAAMHYRWNVPVFYLEFGFAIGAASLAVAVMRLHRALRQSTES